MTPEEISAIIGNHTIDEARSAVGRALAANPADDAAYYCLGRVLWKYGERAQALEAYNQAVKLNPESPARHAIEIARSVFDFFNPDLLNP